jgi:NitT/TauT family transport system substrate-binding protein
MRKSMLAAISSMLIFVAACSAEVSTGDFPSPQEDSGNAEIDLQDPLAPQPLAETATVVVSTVSPVESFAPFFLARELGEFEKENIAIDLVQLPAADSIPGLSRGDIDVAITAFTVTLANAINRGLDIRVVHPGPTRSGDRGDGLWVRSDAAGNPELLKGSLIVGPTTVAGTQITPIKNYLAEVGLSLQDVEFGQMAPIDIPLAMEGGQIGAAWINAPFFVSVEAAGLAERVGGYPDAVFSVVYVYGPSFLEESPEVGEAFLRAIARTERDFMSGNYKENPDTLSSLARALGATENELLATRPMVFDGRLSDVSFFVDTQQAWFEYGGLAEFDRPLEAGELIDTRFWDKLSISR